MRRLNVRRAQIDECIEKSMFALSIRPQNPELRPGELLLLQLVKQEALQLGKAHSRIDFALVFDRLERDVDGTISRVHWPAEGRAWPWIVYGSATVPTIPFSLEDLPLSGRYDGQDNARHIDPRDEQIVLPLIQGELARIPRADLQLVPVSQIAKHFGPDRALSAIYNHDHIARLHPGQRVADTVERYDRNASLAESLKAFYDYHCQVCAHDFAPIYSVKVADTHHIQYLSEGGLDVSSNVIVLCPNHHRVVHETHAVFNRRNLTYEYPNGLRERLILPTHLSLAPR